MSDSTEVYSGTQLTMHGTSSCHGMAPNRRQAITCTNVDKDLRHHIVSLGHNELIIQSIKVHLNGFKIISPSAAYMRQYTGSALVQVMACRLFGIKPLPESMVAYCQLDFLEQISVKFE